MRVSEVFPSRYIEAANLAGKPATLTIERVEERHQGIGIDGKNFTKTLLMFKGKKKGLVCGPLNIKTIRDRVGLGDEMQDWVGKQITIYPTFCKVGKDSNVPCIRVRAVPAGISAEAPSLD